MLAAEMLEGQAWEHMGLSLIISSAQVGAKCLAKQAEMYSVLRMAFRLHDFILKISTHGGGGLVARRIFLPVMTNEKERSASLLHNGPSVSVLRPAVQCLSTDIYFR